VPRSRCKTAIARNIKAGSVTARVRFLGSPARGSTRRPGHAAMALTPHRSPCQPRASAARPRRSPCRCRDELMIDGSRGP